MNNKIYVIDDVPGSLSNMYEIKILICYVLNETNHKITQSQLNKIFQLTKTINYFNFCAALKELISTNHIVVIDKKFLNLTEIGVQAAQEFKSNLPKSTARKTIATLNTIIEQERNNKNRKISIKQQQDGYTVNLILEETGSNLIDLELFCPTEAEAIKFKKELEKKTTDVYRAILAILNDDYRALCKIAKKCETQHFKTQHY